MQHAVTEQMLGELKSFKDVARDLTGRHSRKQGILVGQ
jgi:hypothetical protein